MSSGFLVPGKIGPVALGGAAPWYLAGGAPTPIAAYQPKGAASLAASYVNLANPGTYDAAPGVAPTLVAGGWTFNGTNNYLDTGIVPVNNQQWTLLMCISSHASQVKVTARVLDGAAFFGILFNNSNIIFFQNGGNRTLASSATGGVAGFSGAQGYFNGAPLGETIPSASGAFTNTFVIGASKDNGVVSMYAAFVCSSVVIYNSTLTAGQVAAVSAAMATL